MTLPVLVDAWQPPRFADRGVLVPFTAPALCGARARHGAQGAELVVPNPSGGRGVYIVPCRSLRDFCAPTLHDRAMNHAIASLPGITPASVRQAAREVALTGLAGREAAAAAAEAIALDNSAAAAILAHWREKLGGPAGLAALAGRSRDIAGLEAELDLAAHLIAPSGLVGITGAGRGRLPALAAAMADLAAQTALFGPGAHDSAQGVIWLLHRSAAATLRLAHQALADLAERAADPLTLIAEPLAPRAQGFSPLTAADWLLDGWDRICLIWRLSPRRGSSLAALVDDILRLVPPLPREAAGAQAQEEVEHLRASAMRRPGAPICPQDLIARNEQLRVLAA